MDSVRKVNGEGCKDLETIRKELDLPVTRFCELIGLTRKSYYNAKNGTDTRLSLDQWRRLMEHWLRSGKSIEHLIGCAWQDSLTVGESPGRYSVDQQVS